MARAPNLFYRLVYQVAQSPLVIRSWYDQMSRLDRDADMIFMNYGWASLDPADQSLTLQPEDEPNRYCIQLYHQVASAVDLHGQDVLEVGSGRGGGSSYIARYLGPRSMTGLDFSPKAIEFCQRHYDVPGLHFVRGSAEDLDFADESFDAVVNVESSHCYPSMERFLAGVHRVLKPGGHFLYTDHRRRERVDLLRQQLEESALTLLHEEDIGANVVRALELDNARKQALIHSKVPRPLRGFFNEFAGMEGTNTSYARLSSGASRYLRFVLRKPLA